MKSTSYKSGAPSWISRSKIQANEVMEEALVGSLMLLDPAKPEDKALIAEAMAIATPADFYFPNYRIIAQTLWSLFEAEQKTDALLVFDELYRHQMLDRISNVNLLFEVCDIVWLADNVVEYAKRVKDYAIRRQIMLTTQDIREEMEGEGLTAEIIGKLEAQVKETARVSGIEVETLDLSLAIFRKSLEEGYQSGKGFLRGLPSPLLDLDRKTGGFRNGELIIIAGRPSMGKTTLVLNIIEHLTLTGALPVLFFSLEAARPQIAQNMAIAAARVNPHSLQEGYLSEGELQKLKVAAEMLSTGLIHIVDVSPQKISSIKAIARKMREKEKVRLIVIDYLQRIQPDAVTKMENREQQVAKITGELKNLAKELDVPIIALAQLNRMPEARKDTHPKLSDLRESGAIEQDADVVLLLWRKNYTEGSTDKTAEIQVAKNRYGEVGKVRLFFDPSILRFLNALPPDREPGEEDA